MIKVNLTNGEQIKIIPDNKSMKLTKLAYENRFVVYAEDIHVIETSYRNKLNILRQCIVENPRSCPIDSYVIFTLCEGKVTGSAFVDTACFYEIEDAEKLLSLGEIRQSDFDEIYNSVTMPLLQCPDCGNYSYLTEQYCCPICKSNLIYNGKQLIGK